MKKTIIYASCCIALLVTTVSCKNNSNKSFLGIGSGGQSADAASRVIEYTNLIVDMTNSHNSYLKSMLGNVDRIEKGLKNPGDRFAFIGLISPYITPTGLYNTHGITIDKPVDELGKEDQTYFKTQLTQYNITFDKLRDNYRYLDDYLKAQDYKDDKGAKGYVLIDSIRSTAQKLYAGKITLMKKVGVIADAAEIVVLKDSPLRDYIIAMKTDMKNIRNFIDLLAGNSSNYTKISDKAQADYFALEIAHSKNAYLDIDNAKKANKDAEYRKFYEGFHDMLLHSKKALRDAGEKGKLDDGDIRELDNDYDGLIRKYNYFN